MNNNSTNPQLNKPQQQNPQIEQMPEIPPYPKKNPINTWLTLGIIVLSVIILVIVAKSIAKNKNSADSSSSDSLKYNPYNLETTVNSKYSAQDERIKSNMKLTEIELQIFFQRNETFVGAEAEQEVQSYIKDIEKMGSKLTILTSATTYVMFATLHDKTYFCMDSAGFRDIVKTAPSSSTCS